MTSLSRQLLFGLLSCTLLVGCSTNKTGSQWSLAQINPFKKSEPSTPYPQKPSAFAQPSPVPGDKAGQSLANTGKTNSPLNPQISPQAYPGSQSTSQARASTVSDVTTSNPYANSSLSGNPSANSYSSTASAWDPSRGNNQQTVSAQPFGVAAVSDQRGATSSTTSNLSNNPPSYGLAPSDSMRNPPVTAAYTQGGFGPTTQPAPQGSIPVSYNAPPTSGMPSGVTGGLNPGSLGNGGASSMSVPSSSATPTPPAAGGVDWRQLVGDRYAQMFQHNNGANSPGTNTGAAATGYSPSATGYIPGQTPNPPGNLDYQPGNTGYSPPGVPQYSPPYGVPSSQTGPTGQETFPPTYQNNPSAPAGEYRPGSTKTYVPRTSSTALNTPGVNGLTQNLPNTPSPSSWTVSNTPQNSNGDSFRM